MMRRALGLAAGLMATVGLAQPALAATAPPTSTQSTDFAGYDFAGYIAVPGAVSAIIVVPKLSCRATPPAGHAIYVGVGIQSVNSFSRLYLACTAQGVAHYYPSLVVNGTVKAPASDAAISACLNRDKSEKAAIVLFCGSAGSGELILT